MIKYMQQSVYILVGSQKLDIYVNHKIKCKSQIKAKTEHNIWLVSRNLRQ